MPVPFGHNLPFLHQIQQSIFYPKMSLFPGAKAKALVFSWLSPSALVRFVISSKFRAAKDFVLAARNFKTFPAMNPSP